MAESGPTQSKITFRGIMEDAKAQLKKSRASHNEILELLAGKVNKINFHSLASVPQDEEVPIWKLNVITVDEILRLAKQFNWGLCKHKEFFYIYNGAYWFNLDSEQLMTFLGEVSHKLGVPALRSRYYEFRKKLFSQFQAVANMPAPVNYSGNTLINLLNGTLEIGTGEITLRPFQRSDFITYQLPFAYDPQATAPLFQDYLQTVLPHEEIRKILAEYIGYLFIPNNSLKLEKTLLLYGAGANGKSVFFDVINALLGRENVTTYSLQNLTDKTGYYRAMIGNKLVNYASEINRKLDPAIFKQLVSGEPIDARLPYGQPFILEKYAKLIFNTNELPRDVEHTNAYFRRFLIIPFEVIIPENKQDKNLASKIVSDELPGVLNWVLEGLNRITVNKAFTSSEIIRKQIEAYKNESDTAYLFLEEKGYVPGNEQTIPLREIYNEYKMFCMENNYHAFSKRSFIKQLRAHYFEIKKSNGIRVACYRIDPSKYF